MEEKQNPYNGPVSPQERSDILDAAVDGATVSSFSLDQKTYPIETLEVHTEGSKPEANVLAPTLRSVPFSRRRATIISLFITLFIVLITGGAIAYMVKKNAEGNGAAERNVPTQEVSIDNQLINAEAFGLEGEEISLLVNGDIVTKGEIKVASGNYATVIRTTDLTGNQEFVLPDGSGEICVNSNNCGYATLTQLEQLQGSIVDGTTINGQSGNITIQGTENRVTVTRSGNVINITTPQNLHTGASVQFSSLALSGSLRTATINPIVTGGTITLDAGSGSAVFNDNGRTFTFPAGGLASQEICTDQNNCVAGSGAPTNGEYVTFSANANLSNERVMTAGTNISLDTSTPGQISVNVVSSPTFAGLLTANGGLTVETGDTFTFNGDAFNDLTGHGLQVSGNALTLLLDTGSGLSVGASGLTMLRSCNSDDIMKWNGAAWACAPDATGSGGWTDDGTLVRLTTATDKITIGSATDLSAQLAVDGNADQIQLLVQGNATQTGNLVVFENSSGTDLFTLSGTGSATFRNSADSATAFQVQNAAGNGIFTVDTSDADYAVAALGGTGKNYSALRFRQGATDLWELGTDDVDTDSFYIYNYGASSTPFTLSANGAALFQNSTDSNQALLVLGQSGTWLFNVDSSAENVSVRSALNTFDQNLASTNSHDLTLRSGNAAGATSDSGDVTLDVGTATGTTGSISIGTANASAIAIGRLGVTTTNSGAMTVTQLLTANGGLTVETGDTFTFNGDAFTDLTGTGLTVVGGALQATLGTTIESSEITDGTIAFGDIGQNGCGNNDIMKWNGAAWACANDDTGGGSGVTTIGTLDGQSKSADGAVISGVNLYLQTADATYPGLVSTGSQTFAGAKTFASDASIQGNTTIGDAASDNLTISATIQGANPLVFEGATPDGFETTLAVEDPTADVTYRFATAAVGTYDICTSVGNCVGGAGGAPNDAEYVTYSANATLSNERVLTAGTNISLDTATAGQIAIDVIDNPTFSTSVTTPLLQTSGALTLAATATAGADDIIFQTAGTEKLRVLENGNLFWEKGTDDVTFAITGTTGAATYTFSGASGTVYTSANDPLDTIAEWQTLCTDCVTLGSDTSGNYVATITAGSGISGSSSTEGGTPTIALGDLTANWSQTGAFDVVLANAASELQIMESTGDTYYGLFDVGDLSADQTYTFVQGGTVVTSGNVSSYATTGVTAGNGLTGGGTTGSLTLDIGAGNGVTVNANDITLALQANKGLEVDANGLSLVDCGNDEVLKYSTGTNQWGCASDAAGSGVTAVGTIDSQTKSADGAVISGTTIYLQTADATYPGLVSTGSQTFAGDKTFSGLLTGQAGATVSGADINLNVSSNFATNINTGTSTGAVSIGNSAAGAIALQSGSAIGLTGTTTITGRTTGNALVVNNSTSTGNILVLQDNGSPVFTVADGGATSLSSTLDVGSYVAIGNNASPLQAYVLSVNHTFSSSDTCIIGCQAIYGYATADNPSNADTVLGLQGGRFGVATANTAFTLANAYGVRINSTSKGASSTITNNYGLYIDNQTAGTNDYGLYIQGADTYALYVNSGATYLGGNLSIAGTTQTFTGASGTVASSNTSSASTPSSPMTVTTGTASGSSSNSGSLTLSTGMSVFGSSGSITLQSGNSGSAAAGNVTIDTGTTASGTPTVNIATSNAKAVQVGNTTSNPSISVTSGSSALSLNTGTASGTISIGNSSAGAITLQSGSTIGITGTTTVTGRTTGNALVVNNSSSTGNILTLQDNGSAVFTVADGGSITAVGTVPSAATGTATASTAPYALAVQGRYAYITSYTGNSLQVYDVSNPASPTSKGSVSFGAGSAPFGIAVQGRYAYIIGTTSAVLYVVDISNPASPSIVANTNGTNGSGPHYLHVQGRYAYVTTNTGNTLEIIDISNPASPVWVSSVSTGASSNPEQVYVQGRYAYVAASGSNALQIYDVSNPTSPSSAGSITTNLNDPRGVFVKGRYAYVGSYGNGYLRIYDITNPASISYVGGISVSGAYSTFVQGRYAYVGSYSTSDVSVIDVSNPASPSSVGSVSTSSGTGPINMNVQGRYLYVTNAQASNNFQTFDLGGAYVQQLEAGGLEVTTLETLSNLTVNHDADIYGGLVVGRGLEVTGNSGIYGQLSIKNATTSAALDIQGTSTGNLASLDATNSSANGMLIDIQSSSASQYVFKATSNNGSTTGLVVLGSGEVGIGVASPDARLELAGNLSRAAWGLNGIQLQATAATYTDTSTAASGTATNAVFNSFATPTLAATNSNVTTTYASTVYIQGAPTAGTNQTITNAYALWVDSGNSRFDGNILPGTNDTHDLGSDSYRWKDLYLGGETIHLGTSTTDELSLSYTTSTNLATIGNQASSSNGGILFKNAANSTTAMQIQNASGEQVLAVDTTNTANLVSNPGFETNTTGWAAKGSASIARSTAYKQNGVASLAITTTAAANDGAYFAYTFSPSTTYALSFYARSSAAMTSTLQLGRQDNGSDINCTFLGTPMSVSASGWTLYTCYFTTGGTISGSNIYIKQTDATARTIYIDSVQLEAGTTTSINSNAKLQVDGIFTSPLLVKSAEYTTTALDVHSSGDYSVFNVDTLNNKVNIRSYNNDALTANVVGTGLYAVNAGALLQGGGVRATGYDGYGLYASSWSNISGLFQTAQTDGSNTSPTLVARANTSQTSNVLEVQDASNNAVFTVDANGALSVGTNASYNMLHVAGGAVSVEAGNSYTFNAYWDGSNDKYIGDDSAFEIWHDISTDQLVFVGAASGTADNNITYNDAFAIQANGDISFTGDLLPSSASTVNLGSATYEFNQLFIGDDNGVVLGLDQDATLGYDETTDDRVELTGPNASFFIEDRFFLGVQTLTLTDDGTANDTLTPSATYVRVDIDETADVSVPDLTISETGAKDGQLLIIVNNEQDASEDTFTITNSAGVVQLPGGTNITLGPNDSITLIYMNDRWITLAKSDN